MRLAGAKTAIPASRSTTPNLTNFQPIPGHSWHRSPASLAADPVFSDFLSHFRYNTSKLEGGITLIKNLSGEGQ